MNWWPFKKKKTTTEVFKTEIVTENSRQSMVTLSRDDYNRLKADSEAYNTLLEKNGDFLRRNGIII